MSVEVGLRVWARDEFDMLGSEQWKIRVILFRVVYLLVCEVGEAGTEIKRWNGGR